MPALTDLDARRIVDELHREPVARSRVDTPRTPAPRPVRVTAGAPLPVIVRSLATSGWGALRGREWGGVRDVLIALADMLPTKTAAGTLTAWQISRTAGLSVRWTRVCLQVLEDIGVLEWERGGVVEGNPMPGGMRVVKRELVDIYRTARPAHDQATRDRNARTRARLRKLRKLRVPAQYPKRIEAFHAELSADLPSQEGGGRAGGPRPSAPASHVRRVLAARPDAQKEDEMIPRRYFPVRCSHGPGDPFRCNRCRYVASQAMHAAKASETITYHHAQPKEQVEDTEPLPLTPLQEYMARAYPDLTGAAYARAALTDPEARRLARG